MDQIRAAAMAPILHFTQRLGLPEAELLAELSFDAARLRRMRYISWDEFCTAMAWLEAHAGGAERLGLLFAESFHEGVPSSWRKIMQALAGPKTLLRTVFTIVDPLIFPVIDFGVDDLSDGRMRAWCSLHPGLRPCPGFFHTGPHSVANMPKHFALPPAEVETEWLDDRGMRVLVRLPESRSLLARALRAGDEALHSALQIISGLGEPVTMPARRGQVALTDRVAAAATAWHLTRREGEVLDKVALGLSNKEIASALGCGEPTIEFHMTNILRKSGASGRGVLLTRVWSTEPSSGG